MVLIDPSGCAATSSAWSSLSVPLWHRGAGAGLPHSPSGGPDPTQEAIRTSLQGRWSTRARGNRLGQHGRRGWHADRFTRRIAERTDAASREERLRQERLAAYSGYAGAVSELKRGVITVWFRRRASPPDKDASRAARVESDKLGAAADTANFRLQLVAHDPVLRPLMDTIRAKVGAIDAAEDRQQLIVLESEFDQAVRAFLAAAAGRIG